MTSMTDADRRKVQHDKTRVCSSHQSWAVALFRVLYRAEVDALRISIDPDLHQRIAYFANRLDPKRAASPERWGEDDSMRVLIRVLRMPPSPALDRGRCELDLYAAQTLADASYKPDDQDIAPWSDGYREVPRLAQVIQDSKAEKLRSSPTYSRRLFVIGARLGPGTSAELVRNWDRVFREQPADPDEEPNAPFPHEAAIVDFMASVMCIVLNEVIREVRPDWKLEPEHDPGLCFRQLDFADLPVADEDHAGQMPEPASVDQGFFARGRAWLDLFSQTTFAEDQYARSQLPKEAQEDRDREKELKKLRRRGEITSNEYARELGELQGRKRARAKNARKAALDAYEQT